VTARLTRPTPIVVALVTLVVLAGGLAVAATRPTIADQALVGMVTLAAVAAALVLPLVDPALPITAGLVLSVFSGWWGQMGIPQGLDRPLLVYGIVAAGLTLLPDARRRQSLQMTTVHWLLVVVALYAIGSAVFAGTIVHREPLFALSERLGIMGFLLFAVGPLVFSTPRSRDVLLFGLIGLGAYLSVTALLEMSPLHGLVLPRYIDDPGIGIHYGRARGPFLEAGADGMAMYIALVAACIGFVRWPGRRARRLCGAVIALCGVGIVLTLTRQVWLGAAAGTVVAMAVTASLRRFLVPAIAIVAIALFAALTFVPSFRADVQSRANDQRSVWDRLNSDRAAIDMVDARPLLGWGWYRFADVSPRFLRQSASYPLTTVPRPHNVFLANASELGLVGTSLWLVALLGAIGAAVLLRAPPELEPWRVGLIAVSVNWLVVANFTPLGYALPNHVLWLWPGVVWSGVIARRRRPVPAPAGALPSPA
jgi:hypothetical protein